MNRLAGESSPYLLQHAHNPVDWYPWGPEALQKALLEDKPILVSIGYAACHWCHVMERESFEQDEVAALMNTHFVNIKVDREERPDLDHIYMDALQAMTGSGGWPLNVFLTPDTRPFYGGTYFPPQKAYGRSSWTDTLLDVARAFKDRRQEVEAQADQLTEHLAVSGPVGLPGKSPALADGEVPLVTRAQLDSMFSSLMQQADRQEGGFGNLPKFPQTFSLQWLLKFAHFTGEGSAWAHAVSSLDHLLKGGIYDQLGGGMARYSTDRTWLVPHFEKMLYDNALLVSVLCDAFGLTRAPRFETAIRDVLAFVQREWETAEGGFCSAWDADSEGVEGKFYTWTAAEINTLLGDDAAFLCAWYGVREEGNWDGVNILHRPASDEDLESGAEELATRTGIPPGEWPRVLEAARKRLLEHRATRVPPLLDDKLLLNWNALMNKAFSQAYAVTGDDRYKQTAVRHMGFILRSFRFDPRSDRSAGLGHVYKKGILKHPAFLDDYAYLIQALLWLQEITADPEYLLEARTWTEYVIAHFGEPASGLFYYTHVGQKDLLYRKREIYDGATPSGNAVMAWNLWYLSVAFDQSAWRIRAQGMLESVLPAISRYPGSFGVWADLALNAHYGWNEVAIVGPGFSVFLKDVLSRYIPNRLLMASGGEDDRFPLLAGKGRGEATLAYLCRNYACSAPATNPDGLMEQIKQATQ
jgi:uncharacterized protein